MIIPEKIKILGFDWTVETNKDIAYQGNCYGSTHHASQKIFLEPLTGVSEQKRNQVFIHELMHAIWWQMGLCETYKENKKIEEELVTILSQGLYQVLNDNNMLK